MILFDLIDIRKIRLGLVYIALMALTLVLQLYFFSRVTILGARAMFVPVIVVAIGMFSDGQWGGVCGLVMGLVCDMASSGTRVLFTIVFTVAGFLAGLAGRVLINRRLYSYMIAAVIALAVTALSQSLYIWLHGSAALGALLKTCLLQVLWSLPFGFPAYFAVRSASGEDKVSAR